MTQSNNRLFDDIARLMTDAAGAAQGMRREVDGVVKAQAERFLSEMDLVRREEFDALRDMAIKAREENERLAARLEVLEARLGVQPQTSAASDPVTAPSATADPSVARSDGGSV